MTTTSPPEDSGFLFDESVEAARGGDHSALGNLFDFYKNYLLKIANQELSHDLLIKVRASDLVQDTMVQATRDFHQFRGTTEPEFVKWLKVILQNRATTVFRKYVQTEKRDINRERKFSDQQSDYQSFMANLEHSLTPSKPLINDETVKLFLSGLNALREDFREVIYLKNFEQLTFDEVGAKMQRSSEAARKLWGRAVEQLRQELTKIDPHFNERF